MKLESGNNRGYERCLDTSKCRFAQYLHHKFDFNHIERVSCTSLWWKQSKNVGFCSFQFVGSLCQWPKTLSKWAEQFTVISFFAFVNNFPLRIVRFAELIDSICTLSQCGDECKTFYRNIGGFSWCRTKQCKSGQSEAFWFIWIAECSFSLSVCEHFPSNGVSFIKRNRLKNGALQHVQIIG